MPRRHQSVVLIARLFLQNSFISTAEMVDARTEYICRFGSITPAPGTLISPPSETSSSWPPPLPASLLPPFVIFVSCGGFWSTPRHHTKCTCNSTSQYVSHSTPVPFRSRAAAQSCNLLSEYLIFGTLLARRTINNILPLLFPRRVAATRYPRTSKPCRTPLWTSQVRKDELMAGRRA